jgi:LCP family protein required for cell wall assembly
MIETELREAFGRHERQVPDAMVLVPKINEGVRRRRRRQRALMSAASVVLAVVMVGVGVPLAGRAWLNGRIPTADLIPAETTNPSGPLAGRPLNFLLLGLDHRKGSTDLVRSDAIVVAHVPADRSALYLVTVPRDLQVTVNGDGNVKATEAYAFGGVPAVAKALHDLGGGLMFDGAATIEFTAFRKLAAALGGVRLCVDQRVVSEHYDAKGRYVTSTRAAGIPGYVYEPGCRRMEPWQALDYLRQREDLPQGALDRDRHIAQFLQAAALEVTRSGAMNDVHKVRALLDAVGDSLVVDTGNASLTELFAALRPMLDKEIVPIAMPQGGSRTVGAKAYLVADDRTTDFFAAVRADTVDDWLLANPNHDEYSRLSGS